MYVKTHSELLWENNVVNNEKTRGKIKCNK